MSTPQEVREDIDFFNERAGIREYDGGLPRAEAERLALIEWKEWRKHDK